MMEKLLHYDRNNPSDAVMRLLVLLGVYHILIGIIAGPFSLSGMKEICMGDCGLVTDFLASGGISAAFVNAGLTVLLSVLAVRFSGASFSGNSLASIGMTAGFSFFGINPVNMIPVICGTALYAALMKEPFSKHVHTGIWACCAGPIVQYMFNHFGMSSAMNITAGMLAGIAAGFLIAPCAAATARAHEGMNLYNVGFAAGIVLIALSAVLKGFGFEFASVSTWYAEKRTLMILYLLLLCAIWFTAGWLLNGRSLHGLWELGKRSGQKCDFVALDGLGCTMMNMAAVTFIGIVYIVLTGGDFSGPVLSGILSMFGFAAFGKHYRNVVWVLLGIVLLSFVSVWNLTDPAVQFSALLGTCVCPFGGKYGPLWGMIAGMVHISLVRQTGSFHAWLNLYNNGFAGGIAAVFLVQLAKAFIKDKE